MDILTILKSLQDNQTVNELTKSVGADSNQVKKAVELGLPMLMQAMGNNAKTPQGAASLAKALDQHKEDPLDDVMGFLKGVDIDDGKKILGHVFNQKTQTVEKNLAAQTGMSSNQVEKLLAQLAPVVLGALGKEKNQKNIDANGLTSMIPMLTKFLGSGSNNDVLGMATKLLDADGDGDIMDDVSNMIGGFFKK
jgi:hypothetical protein